MKKKKIVLVIIAIVACVSLLTISYALWTKTKTQSNPNKALTGCFDILLQEESESIQLINTFPISDEDGLNTKAYQFSIENTCPVKAYYQLNLEVLQSSTLSSSYIKISLNGESPVLASTLRKNKSVLENTDAFLLKESELNSGEKATFTLQMWMDKDTPQTEENKTYQTKVTVNAASIDFTEFADNSGAEAPVLDNGMIPVIWNGTDWIKADITKEWYNYDYQWWANAVNVTEDTRNNYLNANTGTKIDMNDILFMWVWVPRYEYRYDNLGMQFAGGEGYWRPGAITINFISKDTLEPSASNFYVHDAFWWDLNDDGIKNANEQLPGIWVAKFELSSNNACGPENLSDDVCNIDTILPSSKPNKNTWVNASLGTYWMTLHKNMNDEIGNKTYGLSNLDTHVIKNMEWGAIAYLSQSKYGKFGNEMYNRDEKEIYNNSSGLSYKYWITGCSSGTSLSTESLKYCQYTYDVEKSGTGASTTGNIYGIYDMSGGTREYVMAFQKIRDGQEPDICSTEFSGKKYDGTVVQGKYEKIEDYGFRYFDLYEYTENWNHPREDNYHPGDATYEVWAGNYKGWYSDNSAFLNINSVLERGGGSGSSSSGIFYVNPYSAKSREHTVRAVAVPLN